MNNSSGIKIKTEESSSPAPIIQFTIPESLFGPTMHSSDGKSSDVFPSDDMSSLLGLGETPSSFGSLTMYKSEPLDTEENSEINEIDSTIYSDMILPMVIDMNNLQNEPQELLSSQPKCSQTPVNDENSFVSISNSFSEEDESACSSQERNSLEPNYSETRNNLKDNISKTQGISKDQNLEAIVHQKIEEYLALGGFRKEKALPTTIPKGIYPSIIMPEFARVNSISFGAQYEPDEIHSELKRYWEFYYGLKNYSPDLALELKPTLTTMFIYFYQECCICSLHETGAKLRALFASKFLEEENKTEGCLLLNYLLKIKTGEDCKKSEFLKRFKSREHRFIFSKELFDKLHHFLTLSRSPVLIHLFTSVFVIQLKDSVEVIETFLQVPPPSVSSSDANLYKEESERVTSGTKALYKLRNSVEANVPSLHHFTYSGKPSCGAISQGGTLVAFGMRTSEINIVFSSEYALKEFKMEQKIQKYESTHSKRVGLEILDEVDEDEDETVGMITTMYGHEGPVYALAFHPKAKLLFSVGSDATLRAWDLTSFTCRFIYRGHNAPIWCLDITDSGSMIVTGSADTTGRVWVPEKTEYVRLLASHYLDVDCVKFHPNEAFVGTGSVDKSVRLWSISDGSLVRVFTGSSGSVLSLAFHNSGKYIIGGGEDSVIRIWDISEGEIFTTLPSPSESLASCEAIDLCGNMLAGGFDDSTLRIWNLRELFGGNKIVPLDEFSIKNNTFSSNSQKYEEDETEGSSDTSISEDEIEPIEMKPISGAFRLPAPKITSLHSSNILKLDYKDFGNLYCISSASIDKNISNEPPPSFNILEPVSYAESKKNRFNPRGEMEEESGENVSPLFVKTQFKTISKDKISKPSTSSANSSDDEDETFSEYRTSSIKRNKQSYGASNVAESPQRRKQSFTSS